jgi:hypothetical protein
MFDLTDDELSALIEACNVAGRGSPRPPWDRAGNSAWRKLIDEERYRAALIYGISNNAYKEASREVGEET